MVRWMKVWLSLMLFSLMGMPALHAQTVEYIHTDALGSPVAVTNSTGVVVERREYEPYGKQTQPALANGPGYTGHVSDAATGLDYMQQRYYDPGIGRFLSMDPVTASGSTGANFNRYWYANNSPYRFTDPDGRLGSCAGGSSQCHGGVVSYAVRSAGPVGDVSSQGGGDKSSQSANQGKQRPIQNSVTRSDYNGSPANGEKKQAVELVGVPNAFRAKSAADNALDAARNSGLPGLHNGPADAFRHCLWSCDMSRAIGADNARLIGDNHEAWGGGPVGETQMDLFNNRAGLGFSSLPQSCSTSCMQGVRNGALILTPTQETRP